MGGWGREHVRGAWGAVGGLGCGVQGWRVGSTAVRAGAAQGHRAESKHTNHRPRSQPSPTGNPSPPPAQACLPPSERGRGAALGGAAPRPSRVPSAGPARLALTSQTGKPRPAREAEGAPAGRLCGRVTRPEVSSLPPAPARPSTLPRPWPRVPGPRLSLLTGQGPGHGVLWGNNPISMWVQARPVLPLSRRWQNLPGGFGPSLPPFCSWQGRPRTCRAGLAKIVSCRLCKLTHCSLLSPSGCSGLRRGLRRSARVRGHVSARDPGPHGSSPRRRGRGQGHCGGAHGGGAP